MACDERVINLIQIYLNKKSTNDKVSFLRSLAGKSAKMGVLGIPESVPGFFPVARVSGYATN